jgi:hypothetical protein
MSAKSTSNSSLTSSNTLAIRDLNIDTRSSMGSINSIDFQMLTPMNAQSTATGSPVKVKLPSWTDRILYKTSLKCDQLGYSCINTITISDHKPVYSILELNVKKIDFKKKQNIYDSLLKESDRMINEKMPRIKTESGSELNFEECMYYDAKILHLTIKNEGVTK